MSTRLVVNENSVSEQRAWKAKLLQLIECQPNLNKRYEDEVSEQ